ncbi:dTDP-4-dehydrorhamnose 3,5-epimerase [Rhizobium ruizarguesonis]|jgi:dTDP-4-dehydrorhamnose 3,5-epimerase|uniref:dTDP-4-dehydrorhamnose 3,5-epimerase n=1 Tax=Rhizobium ruizarguesonis TaxID=2081791 RepID=A0AAE8U1F3_9HYPH|nr:dTDP-4-dehydrorhamnose 3,5-epimerase [Rhizobium ruizarguesonis]MBY5803473.1 dTDP-4-dehydrorhamnose 3,5-epimerase [Rhizobium leguminosarum]NKJ73889.1 dTDP-4-dehydrorhamnose 3,5-epimerase [Rhizobium leguminosarum bv. viciae]QJS27028.1 dTDP-4-dehydrorhamnose 3,5-epimerase [Rhizobium leguminosarum bv. trifolii TA1]MBC2803221.1 dTDP-4-dehydrorhamnose 3,5-epimerase [Rhizobium ruizarguesonis]MBY5831571.1 dTDP-4-dehydrorhamnose 3,5-epimerase [Rhizobium leguminosarum]
MRIEISAIEGIVAITPPRFGDHRGYFSEVFKDAWFRENVADVTFIQDNESLSAQTGTVRGLHFQIPPFAQGKLVRCLAGRIMDVVVDIREGSPSFGKWLSQELSPENGMQLWVPAGFAHGFATLEPNSVISYKVTAPYSPQHDRGIAWNDPAIGIRWPFDERDMVSSDKDKTLPRLTDLPSHFSYSTQQPKD